MEKHNWYPNDPLSIWRKLNSLYWLMEIEMMEYDPSAEVDQQRPTIYIHIVSPGWLCGGRPVAVPSSIEMRIFESGLNAIAAIFLRFSKGKVNDLLL